jgi:PBP1b-binding outer membrane lipoprotein LpoB
MLAANRLSLAAVAALLLVACGSPAPEPKDAVADEAAARELGRDTDKTVLDDMIQTQDRARAVEGVTMDAKRNLDEAVDAQTGGASDESDDN